MPSCAPPSTVVVQEDALKTSSRIRRATLILGSAVALVVAFPGSALAAPPRSLPANAEALEQTFQPTYDYDTDGCYSTPAIGPDGTINGGLNPSGAAQRRVPRRLGPGQHQRVLPLQVQQRLVRHHVRPVLREGPGRGRQRSRRAPPRLGARRGVGAEQPGQVRVHFGPRRASTCTAATRSAGTATTPRSCTTRTAPARTPSAPRAQATSRRRTTRAPGSTPPLVGWNGYPAGLRDRLSQRQLRQRQLRPQGRQFQQPPRRGQAGRHRLRPQRLTYDAGGAAAPPAQMTSRQSVPG